MVLLRESVSTKIIQITQFTLGCFWQNVWYFSESAGAGYQHGDIYYRWCAHKYGVWEIPSTCSCLCWHGLGRRSHGGHAVVVSWAIRTRAVEHLPTEREHAVKCCLCWNADRCLCLGLCFRQIWAEVWVSSNKHFHVSVFYYKPFWPIYHNLKLTTSALKAQRTHFWWPATQLWYMRWRDIVFYGFM